MQNYHFDSIFPSSRYVQCIYAFAFNQFLNKIFLLSVNILRIKQFIEITTSLMNNDFNRSTSFSSFKIQIQMKL